MASFYFMDFFQIIHKTFFPLKLCKLDFYIQSFSGRYVCTCTYADYNRPALLDTPATSFECMAGMGPQPYYLGDI
jgi:hypothetical protein